MGQVRNTSTTNDQLDDNPLILWGLKVYRSQQIHVGFGANGELP